MVMTVSTKARLAIFKVMSTCPESFCFGSLCGRLIPNESG